MLSMPSARGSTQISLSTCTLPFGDTNSRHVLLLCQFHLEAVRHVGLLFGRGLPTKLSCWQTSLLHQRGKEIGTVPDVLALMCITACKAAGVLLISAYGFNGEVNLGLFRSGTQFRRVREKEAPPTRLAGCLKFSRASFPHPMQRMLSCLKVNECYEALHGWLSAFYTYSSVSDQAPKSSSESCTCARVLTSAVF